MKTHNACKAAQEVYGLDTSKVPTEVESDQTRVTVGCILHGEYETRYHNIRARQPNHSPGCPECRKTYQKCGLHFQMQKKIVQYQRDVYDAI